MTNELIINLETLLFSRFEDKTPYFDNFVKLDTGPEEWFRIEILNAISDDGEIEILSTNQNYKNLLGRPDFVFSFNKFEYIVELKVLPPDRNYKTGYQRFCAGKTNKADFSDLENGDIDIVIYLHWPIETDFVDTKIKLEKRYDVKCTNQKNISFNHGIFTLSFWQQNV